MIIRILCTLICLFIFNVGFGQDKQKYAEFVMEGYSLYEAKEYKKSAASYQAAFDELDGKAISNDRYNAACSYALSGNSEQSFFHLYRLAESPVVKYRNLSHITNDVDLNSLHSDRRWDSLIETITSNKEEYEKDFDKPLVALLDSIYTEDQSYRRQIHDIQGEFGMDSDEMTNLWKIIDEKDSLNLMQVKKILDKRGWLGADIIGDRGNSTLFLVIQHSDLETQLKYLPMMRDAVKNGNARGSSLALLEDRVALGQGNQQVYGSQIGTDKETGEYYVLPLSDPENVDARRAEVGLGPLAEYIGRWDMVWDVEKYKEQIKQIEEKKEK